MTDIEAKRHAGHPGDHRRTTDAGVLTWSDPMDSPPSDEHDDYDEHDHD